MTKIVAWAYYQDGNLELPILTTKRWAVCEEPWSEVELVDRREVAKYRVAWEEFQEKTEWVQATATPLELGMHRADVLRQRIRSLEAELHTIQRNLSRISRRQDVTEQEEFRLAFEAAARPLIKWLCENVHPHHTAVVTPIGAELLEGRCSTGKMMDYVRD